MWMLSSCAWGAWVVLLLAAGEGRMMTVEEEGGERTASSEGLVRVVVGMRRSDEWYSAKMRAALVQLEGLLADRSLEREATEALVGEQRFSYPYEMLVARVLAAAGGEADRLVFEEFRSLCERRSKNSARMVLLAVSTALAEDPSDEVTNGLVQIARESPDPSLERTLCFLALAARGDAREDWVGQVERLLLGVVDGRVDAGISVALREAFPYVAGKLLADGPLATPLWSTIESQNGRAAAVDALISLAALGREALDPSELPRLRTLAAKPLDKQSMGERTVTHFALARLGLDPAKHVSEGLAVIGSPWWGDHTDSLVYQVIVDLLLDETLASLVGARLRDGTVEEQIGGLWLVCTMGPRARDLRPALAELLSSDDPMVRALASLAMVHTSGLDPTTGRWRAAAMEEEAYYRAIAAAWRSRFEDAGNEKPGS